MREYENIYKRTKSRHNQLPAQERRHRVQTHERAENPTTLRTCKPGVAIAQTTEPDPYMHPAKTETSREPGQRPNCSS